MKWCNIACHGRTKKPSKKKEIGVLFGENFLGGRGGGHVSSHERGGVHWHGGSIDMGAGGGGGGVIQQIGVHQGIKV